MACNCGTCSCCTADDICPAIVPVTINENTYELDDGALAISVVAVDASNKTLQVQVQDSDGNNVAGYFRIKLWFTDTDAEDGAMTVTPPTDPGVAEWWAITDSTGLLSFNVGNTGALDTWYLAATLGFGVTLSAAITIGS